jgi:hypothetical protein
MLDVRNQEWLALNANRAYPICDDATQQDVTGKFKLPKDFMVSLYLAIHAGLDVDPSQFHIMTIGAYASGYSIVVGYYNGTTSIPVASALIARAAQTHRNIPYRLGGIGDFVDTTGHVVIGDLSSIDEQPVGQWSFGLDDGRLELDTITPNIRNVSALRIRNGTSLSDRIYGDVILTAGKNMRLTPILEEGMDPVIVFDALQADGLNEPCVCVTAALGDCIRTINQIGPTPDGDFTVLGNDCLQVVGITNGLQLTDSCSEPCCGCTELETVTSALEQFGAQATTLENFLVSLEARVTQMDQVVLGSQLGDRGCLQCAGQQGGA